MQTLSQYILAVAISLIMVGIGMSTKVSDFQALVQKPKATLTGFFSQLILLPCIALAMILLMDLEGPTALGLLLLAFCPSGSGSNIITKMVKGNLALSVSLTVVSTFFCLVSIPFLVPKAWSLIAGEGIEIHLPVWDTTMKVFITAIIPVCTGLIISEKRPDINKKLRPTLKWLLPTMLFVSFGLVYFLKDENKHEGEIFTYIPYALLINVASMVLTFLFSSSLRLSRENRIAISIDAGLKNSGIGLLISMMILKNQGVSEFLIVYGVTSFYVTLGLGFIIGKIAK